jgi:hypothetical protein
VRPYRAVMDIPGGELLLPRLAAAPSGIAAPASPIRAPDADLPAPVTSAMVLPDCKELERPISSTTDWAVIATDAAYIPRLLGSVGGIRLPPRTYVFAHANSRLEYALDERKWKAFDFAMGLDDIGGTDGGAVVYRVLGDGRELFRSPTIRSMEQPQQASVNIAGVKKLELIVDADGRNSSDEAYWIKPTLR